MWRCQQWMCQNPPKPIGGIHIHLRSFSDILYLWDIDLKFYVIGLGTRAWLLWLQCLVHLDFWSCGRTSFPQHLSHIERNFVERVWRYWSTLIAFSRTGLEARTVVVMVTVPSSLRFRTCGGTLSTTSVPKLENAVENVSTSPWSVTGNKNKWRPDVPPHPLGVRKPVPNYCGCLWADLNHGDVNHLYHNCEKYPLSPLKLRCLVLIEQYLHNISGPVYSVNQSFMWFLWLNWRKSTFIPSLLPN